MNSIKSKISSIIRKIFKMQDFSRSKISYSQIGEDLLIRYIFNVKGIKNISYIDIGAHDPFYLSNTALFYETGSTGINVEANPVLFNIFEVSRKKDINLNIGICEKEGDLDFYVFHETALSTFNSLEAERLVREEAKILDKKIKVNVVSINKVIDKYLKGIAPDFLNLDAESMDIAILKSLNFDKFAPKVICVETISYSNTFFGVKNEEIKNFLISKGYFLFGDTYVNSIFVKRSFWLG